MNHLEFLRIDTKQIVFVWDGSDRHIDSAEQFVGQFENVVVHSLHAMPHESIYSYGPCRQSRDEMASFERRLHREYRKAVRSAQNLGRRSRFEVLFGDRINEIVRFAEIVKARFILTPRFEQSNFSRWIHGDLNERIVRQTTCPVVFLDAESGNWTSLGGQRFTLATSLPKPEMQ